jgi:hypothetical protein
MLLWELVKSRAGLGKLGLDGTVRLCKRLTEIMDSTISIEEAHGQEMSIMWLRILRLIHPIVEAMADSQKSA